MTHAEIAGLYVQFGPVVLRRARAILGDEQAAKDAMQEVFVRALKAGPEFRHDASPITWLYRVTTNLCLNVIRDGGRRAELLAEQGPPAEAGHGENVDDRMTVAQVLARVPEELREIAIYYYADQLHHDEIAALLGVSRRTVGNRIEEFLRAAELAMKPRVQVAP